MADYAEILRDHVTLRCRSIDRLFVQAYVPNLQSVGLVCRFLRWQRGFPIPSSAAFGRIGDAYVQAIHRFAEQNDIPIVQFKKGQNKEETAAPYLDAAAREGKARVVLIGVAQEKASVWRSWPTKGQEKHPHPHMEWGRQMAYINHYYFYLWDSEWGGAFWKTNAYAPFPIWIWLNGHEWAKRQLEKAGIGYEALDNGFRSCDDPVALQQICDQLGVDAYDAFFDRWVGRLPSPFTLTDTEAGYVYQSAFRQFEVAETCVFDRPQAGRWWFDGVIRDHLDIGRPHEVGLLFDRRISGRTPGVFRTRVLRRGVDPTLCCYYRASRLKQYLKDGRALRTELVICDTKDFGIGRRVCAANWNALRAVGESANRRLCEAELADAQPAPDVATVYLVTQPSLTEDGQPAAALRFGDPRVMAVLAVLVGFCHVPAGFRNRTLAAQVAEVLNQPYSSRQATYDLRRLRRKGLIVKVPRTQRYEVTSLGRRIAVLFTKTYARVLAPGLALIDPHLPEELGAGSPLASAWRRLDIAMDQFIERQRRAA